MLAGIMFVPVVNAQENTTKELTFGPETLNELKKAPDFIAAYGSIPTFATSEERKQWLDKLDMIYTGVNVEMSKYTYPNGPVTRYGYSINGVLEVAVNKEIKKPWMDEIYQIFDSKASHMGINEIPVVFVHGDIAVPVDLTVPVDKVTANSSTSGEKSTVELNNSNTNNSENSEPNNGSSSDVNNSGGNKSSKNNSAPGFGLLGSLTCLYGGWRLSKK